MVSEGSQCCLKGCPQNEGGLCLGILLSPQKDLASKPRAFLDGVFKEARVSMWHISVSPVEFKNAFLLSPPK